MNEVIERVVIEKILSLEKELAEATAANKSWQATLSEVQDRQWEDTQAMQQRLDTARAECAALKKRQEEDAKAYAALEEKFRALERVAKDQGKATPLGKWRDRDGWLGEVYLQEDSISKTGDFVIRIHMYDSRGEEVVHALTREQALGVSAHLAILAMEKE